MAEAAVAVPSARSDVAVRADVVAAVALAVLTAGLAVATWGTWGDLDSDTGYDLVAATRVAGGHLPYADFVYYYGPLPPAAIGALLWLGVSPLAGGVAFGLAVTLAIVGATFALARVVLPPLGAFLAGAITAAVAFIPDNYGYVLPHTNAATLGTLALLAVLLALWRAAATARTAWWVVAGGVLGVSALTKPEALAGAVAAAAVLLALRARVGAPWRRELLLVGGPALLVPALVYGSLLLAVSPGTLLWENLWPVDELSAGGDTLVDVRMPLTVASALELGARLLLYAVGIAVLLVVAYGLHRPGRHRTPLLVAVAVCAAAAAAAAVVNPEALRHGLEYAWAWLPAGVAVAAAFVVGRDLRRRTLAGWAPAQQLETAAVVALAVVAATTYGAFYLHAPRPQMAVYYAPLAAVFMARLHLVDLARTHAAVALGALWVGFLACAGIGLTLKDARAESATVRGPGGALAERPSEAALYASALAEIESRTSDGEGILVGPLLTGLYVLADRESPLRELSLLPSALATADDEAAAVERLRRADVRLVLTDGRTWPAYGQGVFGETFHRGLAAWLERHYDRVNTLRSGERTIDVWTRRDT